MPAGPFIFPFTLKTIGERESDVAESAVDDAEIVAGVEGYHRSIVHTQSERTALQGETEPEGTDGTEEHTGVVVAAVVKTDTAAKAAPELPSAEIRGPFGPLLDVPVVHRLKRKTVVKVEQSGRAVQKVLVAEVVLIFQVYSGASEMGTDGMIRTLRTGCEG